MERAHAKPRHFSSNILKVGDMVVLDTSLRSNSSIILQHAHCWTSSKRLVDWSIDFNQDDCGDKFGVEFIAVREEFSREGSVSSDREDWQGKKEYNMSVASMNCWKITDNSNVIIIQICMSLSRCRCSWYLSKYTTSVPRVIVITVSAL